jgi:hypothetical protein
VVARKQLDRLQASPDPAIATSLRSDAVRRRRQRGRRGDSRELDARPLDVRLYDPSGLGAATHGAFVTSLARTVGHFRGQGERIISGL